jgi:hypothetical protein
MRAAAFGSFLVVAAVTAAAAGTWEMTRKEVIEPINAEFHRHLPTSLKNHDLDALGALYVTATGTGLGWDDGQAAYPDRGESTLTWDGPSRHEPIRERLGPYDGVQGVEIEWPSGDRTTLGPLAGDRLWTIVEGAPAGDAIAEEL